MPKSVEGHSSLGAARACDSCHRMKIRCIDRANPPCRRCSTMGLSCTFAAKADSPYRVKSNQDRIAHLENQMGEVYTSMRSMEDMMRTLIRSNGSKVVSASIPSDPDRPLPATLDGWVQTATAPQEMITARHNRTASPAPFAVEEDEYEREEEDIMDAATIKNIMIRDEDERLRQESLSYATTRANPTHEGQARDPEALARQLMKRLGAPIPTQRGNLLQEFPDPVHLGYCTEAEARHLFDLYFEGAHAFLPVLDVAKDTWESLRARSSFCLTAVLIAGQLASTGNGRTSGSGSSLRQKLVSHAEKIALATLFSPVASIEAVQAMVILANWGDAAWRPGNHALSLAFDMDLHLCLPYLAKTGMGRDRTPEELERERPLVAGARVWLAVCKTHTELCLNYVRPVHNVAHDVVKFGRLFLEHPLAHRDDSRCVVLCEEQVLREPLHRAKMEGDVPGHMLDSLVTTNMTKIASWETHWLDYYANMGFSPDDFLVTELCTVKNYATLSANISYLSGVRSRAGVRRLPPHRRECLAKAVRAAAANVARAARGAENAKLRHGNRNVRLGLAHAARSLIRMASLLPEAIDLYQAAKDVELLAEELSRFPDFYFSQFLHHVVVEARRKRDLPPATAHTSPRMGGEPLNRMPDALANTILEFDFSIADDIFASEDWMSILGGAGSMDQQPVTASSVFPFFPLGEWRGEDGVLNRNSETSPLDVSASTYNDETTTMGSTQSDNYLASLVGMGDGSMDG